MASLELVRFRPHAYSAENGQVRWTPLSSYTFERLPQIFWDNSRPWAEANLWLLEKATSGDVTEDTVHSNGVAIHAYAQWLELTATSWTDFPQRKSDRCLIKYRRNLKERMKKGELSTSTAANRIRVVVSFYRWLNANKLISAEWPMWTDKLVGVRLQNSFGFERTILVNSTDLAISNKKINTDRLEDGLLPVSQKLRDSIICISNEQASQELALILSLGFFTGMRLGTICDLRLETIDNALPDPAVEGLFRLAIGPEASPGVHTKGGVSGYVWILKDELDQLKEYMYSVRRLTREALAKPENRNLIFLTRFGNPYTRKGADRSSVINVEIHNLRKVAIARGVNMREFKFHQSRATYATELTKALMENNSKVNVLAIVQQALLHKNESTTLKYIKFVEKNPAKINAANAFTRAFLGIRNAGATNA